MFPAVRLAEEGVERVFALADTLVIRHETVRLDVVLETEEFPACIAHLDTCLAHVHGNDFTL